MPIKLSTTILAFQLSGSTHYSITSKIVLRTFQCKMTQSTVLCFLHMWRSELWSSGIARMPKTHGHTQFVSCFTANARPIYCVCCSYTHATVPTHICSQIGIGEQEATFLLEEWSVQWIETPPINSERPSKLKTTWSTRVGALARSYGLNWNIKHLKSQNQLAWLL